MSQKTRTRRQASTIKYSANNKISEGLSRGMIYREILLRLKGTPTIAAVDNTGANTGRGDAWAAIKKIELIANGTDVLKTLDANALFWFNLYWYSVAPTIEPTIGDAATANPAFDLTMILPLWMPRSIRPLDTALDSRELSSLEVAITWGDHTDVNSAATGWTVEPTVEIGSLESFNISGPFSQWRIFAIEKAITASNSQFQIKLPVGKMYRGFLLNTTDAGVDSGAILNNVKLISGTTVFFDLNAGVGMLPQWTRQRQGIVRTFDAGGNDYDAFQKSANSDVDGWLYLDLVTDGFLSEAIDTLGLSEFTMELDVTVGAGATKLVVYPMQIIPVRGGPNG